MEPRSFLRLEGLTVLSVALAGYFALDGPIWLLLVLALAPDLAMIGYLAGSRLGSLCYNVPIRIRCQQFSVRSDSGQISNLRSWSPSSGQHTSVPTDLSAMASNSRRDSKRHTSRCNRFRFLPSQSLTSDSGSQLGADWGQMSLRDPVGEPGVRGVC